MKKIIIKLLILVLIIQTSFNLIDIVFKSSNAATKIYLKEGETTTIVPETSSYTLADPSVADVEILETAKANIGTNSSYTGTEVTLESCEYTWADAGRGNGTYYATNGSLYLYLDTGNPTRINYNSVSPLTVTNNNGDFTIGYTGNGSYYLAFDTANNYFTVNTNSVNAATVNLYEAASNISESSSEIPGYKKVNEITLGSKYLIVKQNGGNYYILYPKQKSNYGSSNYDETAKINSARDYTCNITGKKSGTTTLTIGSDEYTIIVYDENEEVEIEPGDDFEDKALIINQGLTYTLQTNTNSTITWTSEDTSIATVDRNGRVTAVAEGSTTIKATLGGVTYSIPVTVLQRYTTSTSTRNYRTVNIHIDSDDETTTYYNYSHETQFVEAHDGTRVYIRTPRYENNYVNFYAAPDDGYALSYMSGWYAPIVEETQSEVASGNGPSIFSNTQGQYFNDADMATAVGTAYSNGAEGMFGYATYNTNVTQTLTVRSEKLPKVSQKVYSINGESYSNGDVAYPGDEVIFEVTISKGAYDYVVNYDGTLTNSLNGAVFLGTSPTGTGTSASQAVSISTTGSYSQTYYVKYTIPSGTTGNVTNTTTFNYESYGNASTTNRTGYVDSTASYKTDRTGNASATVKVGQIVQKSYITLGKEVAGNMRETDKYFKFLVDIQGTAGDEYTITGQDSTITYNGSQVTTSSTYTVGSTNYVYLKGGQTITIGIATNGTTTQVPVGVTYTITEQDAEEYITTIQGIQGETKTTGNLTILGTTNTVEFLNSRDAAAMTGRFFEITEYAIILAGSIIFILLIRRQKKRK